VLVGRPEQHWSVYWQRFSRRSRERARNRSFGKGYRKQLPPCSDDERSHVRGREPGAAAWLIDQRIDESRLK
jgi:hypothetical protein